MTQDQQPPKTGLRRETPALDQQPERAAIREPRAVPPKRTATMPGIPSVPIAPPLPAELAATRHAPANPLRAKTWRIPTPPSAVALARRSDPPEGDPLPPPSQSPDAASQEALRRRAEGAEAELAELRRRERVRAETASPNTFPPRVAERGDVQPPKSAPPDAALGRSLRYLAGRLWPLFLAAAGVGGGVTAVAKPTVDPAKADAVLASQQAMQADVALLREQVAGMLKREAARDQYTTCLEEALEDMGSQLLPAQDRQGSAAPLRAWIRSRCQRLRP